MSSFAENETARFNIEHYVLKHLSHFVRRGARRIGTADGEDALAFVNPDGSTVVVLANPGKEKRTCPFASNRRSAR